MITLQQLNESLTYPVDDEVLNKIVARQLTASTLAPTPPSVWCNYFSPDWVIQMDGMNGSSLENSLQPIREKIRTKWWGPQGRPFMGSWDEAIRPYTTERKVATVRDLVTRTGWVLIRAWLRPIVLNLAERVRVTGSIVKSPREAYTQISRKEKSNSGYRGFTTELSRDPYYLRQAIRALAPRGEWDPMITWYRDMRQKQRLIFGGSLQHVMLYQQYLSAILTDSLKCQSSVFYHSEMQESYLVSQWLTKHPGATAVECDYEQMDSTVSEELATQVLEILLDEVPNLPTYDRDAVLAAMRVFFNVPLVDFNGNVHFSHWNLLSGIGPTNGIENLINAFVQLISIGRIIDKGINFPDFLLRVMGDDSALLIATNKESTLIPLFVSEFEEVSTSVGLVIQRQKQAVSDMIYCFCRRYYPLNPNLKGFKKVTVQGRQCPWPIYPLDYSINSALYPEDPSPWTCASAVDSAMSREEVQRLFSLLDNAWGDPRVIPFLNRLTQNLNLEALVDDLVSSAKLRSSWREKVYGEQGWSPVSSPSCDWVFRKFYK